MCGAPARRGAYCRAKEIAYLDSLVRGVYARRDLPEGHVLSDDDVYLAIPLQKGQISCRELIGGDPLIKAVFADQPIMLDSFDTPYAANAALREKIAERGL